MEKLQNSMTKLTLYKQKEDFYSWVIFKKKEKNTFQQKKVIICPKTLLFTWQKLFKKKKFKYCIFDEVRDDLPESRHSGLQLVYGRRAIVVVGNESIEPA